MRSMRNVFSLLFSILLLHSIKSEDLQGIDVLNPSQQNDSEVVRKTRQFGYPAFPTASGFGGGYGGGYAGNYAGSYAGGYGGGYGAGNAAGFGGGYGGGYGAGYGGGYVGGNVPVFGGAAVVHKTKVVTRTKVVNHGGLFGRK